MLYELKIIYHVYESQFYLILLCMTLRNYKSFLRSSTELFIQAHENYLLIFHRFCLLLQHHLNIKNVLCMFKKKYKKITKEEKDLSTIYNFHLLLEKREFTYKVKIFNGFMNIFHAQINVHQSQHHISDHILVKMVIHKKIYIYLYT